MTKASADRVARRASKNGNGKGNGADPMERIPLSDPEKQQIINLDAVMARKKIDLANAVMQVHLGEIEKNRLLRELKQHADAFDEATRSIATGHGIDPDGREGWQLDLKSFELFKR